MKGNLGDMTPEQVYKILSGTPKFVEENRSDVKVLREFMQQEMNELTKYYDNLADMQQHMDKKVLNQYKRLPDFKNQVNKMYTKLQGINQELDVILNRVNKLISEKSQQNEVVE